MNSKNVESTFHNAFHVDSISTARHEWVVIRYKNQVHKHFKLVRAKIENTSTV